MSRLPGCLLIIVTAWSGAAETTRGADSPFPIGTRTQLLIDQTLVSETDHVFFTLHPGKKHPQNPLMRPDYPWEGWGLQLYGSVLFDADEQIFKMWYFANATDYFPDFATYYATSVDGIIWEKPLIGTARANIDGPHNAVVEGVLLASVTKDLAEKDPARRYKMVGWRQKAPHGAQTMVSPDGLHWTELQQKICRSSDVITAFYHPYRQQYVAFPKLVSSYRGHVRRTFGLTTSENFLDWIPSQGGIFRPDLRDDAGSLQRVEQSRHLLDRPDDPALMRTEFYGIGAYPHESGTVAFPWVFTINNNARYGNHEGPIEIQLAASRDLRNWARPFRTPIVPCGEKGAWDEGMVFTANRAIDVGDEVWLYYGGANYTHGNPVIYREKGTGRLTRYTCRLGLVIWKKDRFVSADGPAEGGTLTSVPVLFSGNQLRINARTRPGGSVAVALCDAAGVPLPGFERSEPFSGDALRHNVAFDNGVDLSTFTERPVVLRFYLAGAQLFSFGFHDGQ